MLYLEDYLESEYYFGTHVPAKIVGNLNVFVSDTVIEHLPQELRDRFTEMRELDLSVQSKFGSIGT